MRFSSLRAWAPFFVALAVSCGGAEGSGADGDASASDSGFGVDSRTIGVDVVPTDGTADNGDGSCGDVSFPFTDTQISFVVPAGVRYMHVKAWGAGGNGEGQCTGTTDGGMGGYTEAVFGATPGQPLIVIVGVYGRAGTTGEDIMREGFGSHGGGGLSGVFRGPDLITDTDEAKALVVAGGGGSAGAPGCLPGGPGNAATAGGMPTMLGGDGVDTVNGGGGGYKGGLGGGHREPGNGGTWFVAATALDEKHLAAAPRDSKPPNSTDPDYDGKAGQEETSGRVVIHFVCDRPVIK